MSTTLRMVSLAALAGLSFAPAAWAQTGCEPYKKLVAAMSTGFASLKGKEDEYGDFAANLSLDGECKIRSYDNSYKCHQYFKEEAEARATASAWFAKAKPCFPGWTSWTTDKVSSVSPGNRDTLGSQALV